MLMTDLFITTIKERCRVCYACVRECPAKAIRISGGQAEIVPERCIRCGNCVRVCSQGAKQVVDTVPAVRALLASGDPVVAMVAPSFPAEFVDWGAGRFVGALRALGFARVVEVAFGADLVARRYRELLQRDGGARFVSTPCPAVVAFVERYHPGLVDALAPVVSPMIAMARVVRRDWAGERGPRIVFIGPCVAKKAEIREAAVAGEVDEALTFAELRAWFEAEGVEPERVEEAEFDPPYPGLGALFPLERGLLQTAALREDLLDGEVVAAEGRVQFVEVLREFESRALDARLLDILACNGCIMGPGMTTDAPRFRRRALVSRHVRAMMETRPPTGDDLTRYDDLDLTRGFEARDSRMLLPGEEEDIQEILGRMGKFSPEDELNCGACGYDTCREHAIAIKKGLAESEMCLPYVIEQLRRTVHELETSHRELAQAQEALMHSERLASMGQLAAGIAHEVNNPLGVVVMYAHLLLEQVQRQGDPRMVQDVQTIVSQADRCRKIVAGLLDFARQNKVSATRANLPAMLEAVAREVAARPGIEVEVRYDDPDLDAELDVDQVTQVLVNLVRNSLDAMPEGGRLTLEVSGDDDRVRFSVEDTGVGIPEENVKRIFEPFFTTKGVGKGTGLGLSVSYGIVKMHHGNITVESNAEPSRGPTGTRMTVTLPRRRRVGFGEQHIGG